MKYTDVQRIFHSNNSKSNFREKNLTTKMWTRFQFSKSEDKQVRKRKGDSVQTSSKVARVTENSRPETDLYEPEELKCYPSPLESSTRSLLIQFDRSQLPRCPISIGSSSSSSSSSSPIEILELQEETMARNNVVDQKQAMARNSVVDLTADSDKEELTVVDLTSPIEKDSKVWRRLHEIRAAAIVVPEADGNDVIIIPPTPPTPSVTSHHHHPPPKSPSSSHGISCPICMESSKTFTATGRTLVTTKCGHLFCDICIKRSIQLMHKCPTCFTKLTVKQYHRIYI